VAKTRRPTGSARPPGTTRVPRSFCRAVHADEIHSRTTPTSQPTPGMTTPPIRSRTSAATSSLLDDGRRLRGRATRLGGDVGRVAEAVEEVPHVRLALVPETGTGLGDVIGDLLNELATASRRKARQLLLEPVEVVVDQLVSAHFDAVLSTK
jgi:hypothetical protein